MSDLIYGKDITYLKEKMSSLIGIHNKVKNNDFSDIKNINFREMIYKQVYRTGTVKFVPYNALWLLGPTEGYFIQKFTKEKTFPIYISEPACPYNYFLDLDCIIKQYGIKYLEVSVKKDNFFNKRYSQCGKIGISVYDIGSNKRQFKDITSGKYEFTN